MRLRDVDFGSQKTLHRVKVTQKGKVVTRKSRLSLLFPERVTEKGQMWSFCLA